ncbi:MAG: ABC transporter permease subunit [Alphaproteobacteria bacterium]|nr:ABC transporter permease subunit [Alphaproteobacteria bacterium]
MRETVIIFRREFAGYFATPLASVFIVIFLVTAGAFTLFLGRFFDRGQASLESFFTFHPWLYLLLIPAISMRLWAEERKTGTIELLLTLPVTVTAAVLGKFLAAWAFTAVALAGTVPFWITVNVLGTPDNGTILAGYIGSLFMAGAYLAIGAAMSALTRNQVIAFILAAALCFLFVVSGTALVQEFFSAWAPTWLLDSIGWFSFLSHFQAISRGVIDLRDFVFFASVIALFLFANVVAVERRKAQ